MISYLTTDSNCPTCFNAMIEAITNSPGVHHVDPHVADGCIAVTHDTDEQRLLEVVAHIGRKVDVAGNGEIVMDRAEGGTVTACQLH